MSTTKEQTVIVKVDDNAKMEFSRSAIAQVITEAKDKTEKIEKKSKSDKKTQSEDSIPAKEEK